MELLDQSLVKEIENVKLTGLDISNKVFNVIIELEDRLYIEELPKGSINQVKSSIISRLPALLKLSDRDHVNFEFLEFSSAFLGDLTFDQIKEIMREPEGIKKIVWNKRQNVML